MIIDQPIKKCGKTVKFYKSLAKMLRAGKAIFVPTDPSGMERIKSHLYTLWKCTTSTDPVYDHPKPVMVYDDHGEPMGFLPPQPRKLIGYTFSLRAT